MAVMRAHAGTTLNGIVSHEDWLPTLAAVAGAPDIKEKLLKGVEINVTDRFTTGKFNNPYTCSIMQVECDFFKQLETGRSAHYKLIAEFSYHLPAFLAQINIEYVNPTIRVYERMQ